MEIIKIFLLCGMKQSLCPIVEKTESNGTATQSTDVKVCRDGFQSGRTNLYPSKMARTQVCYLYLVYSTKFPKCFQDCPFRLKYI